MTAITDLLCDGVSSNGIVRGFYTRRGWSVCGNGKYVPGRTLEQDVREGRRFDDDEIREITLTRNQYNLAVAADGSHHHLMQCYEASYWMSGMRNAEDTGIEAIAGALDTDSESQAHALLLDFDGV